jgi:hypothetical protein
MHRLMSIMLVLLVSGLPVRTQTDFRISEENIPATFQQRDPRLYSDPPSGFIVAWEDHREGNPVHYAQRFDRVGNPIGTNFRIHSNFDLSMADDNSFFSLRESFHTEYFPPYDERYVVSLHGRIYKNSQAVTEPFLLVWQDVPWCGTGVLARNHELTYGAGFHLFTINWGFHLRKYDTDGNLVHIEMDRYAERYAIGNVSTAITDRGDYMLTWFNADDWETTPGVYGTFFNAQDSVVADSVGIFLYEGYDEWYWFGLNDPIVHAVPVADTVYQIFVIRRDTLSLSYRKFDRTGNPIDDVYAIDIPAPEPSHQPGYSSDLYSDASFARGGNGEIFLFATAYSGPDYITSVITFEPDGSFAGEIKSIDAPVPHLHRGVHHMRDSTFLVSAITNDDVYLYTLSGFGIAEERKVNDDALGGNQVAPRVTTIDENTFFVSWNDEVTTKGRNVRADGSLGGDEIILDTKNVLFFSDGTMLSPWRKSFLDISTGVGYTLHNGNLDVIVSDTLANAGSPLNYYLRITAAILENGTAIITYTTPDELLVRQIASTGTVVHELTLGPVSNVSDINIFKESGGSFWINWIRSGQKFDSQLTPLSDVVTTSTVWNAYLGDGIILHYDKEYFTNNYNGTFITVNGDTIAADIHLAQYATEFTVQNIPDNRFLVLYRSDGRLFTRAYSQTGVTLGDSVVIHQGTEGAKKNLAAHLIDDRVLFTWAEVRPPGYGYDIYGRILSLNDIVTSVKQLSGTVPNTYVLMQNYPNPFNPATRIQYSIPTAGPVTIRMYDILGKEVGTLVNEYQQPGTYDISFNGDNLSSGVYIYRLDAGEFTAVKRMVLVR